MNRLRLYMSAGSVALILVLAGFSAKTAQAKPWVTAYVGGWWFNSNDNGTLPIANINFKGMTVCDHMGLLPLSTPPFIDTAVVNGWVTNSMFVANSQKLTAAAHAAGVKCTFTIGAWNTESQFMAATTPANLPTFVNSLVSFLKYRGYDGVDVDWEPLSPADTVQYKNFIIALRNALPSPYLISVTCGWGSPYSMFASIQNYVDQINIMTYDLSWNSAGFNTWYAGAVFSNGVVDPYDNKTPAVSCNYLVGLYEAVGVKGAKLGIGSEAGGMLWKGCTAANQSLSTVTSVTPDVSYNTIMSKYYKPGLYHWDSGAEAAYLSFDTTGSANDWFLSYDDTTALKAKLAYTQTAGIGGVIIYEIGMSYNQATGANPFLQASEEFLDGSSSGGGSATDIIPPSVSISSPANDAQISGSVTVSAVASDNVGVSDVQFYVDGGATGNPLTSAPYSISLNTASLSNGNHVVSAMAIDAAGNKATAYDTLTVNNGNGAASISAGDSTFYVYRDSLSSPWINASYGAAANFSNATTVYSGTHSIEITSNPWGALYIHDGEWGTAGCLDCTPFDSLTFRVHSGSNISFMVFFANDSGQAFKSVTSPVVTPDEWTRISVPLSAINPSNHRVQYIGIEANSGVQQTYYLDNIALKDSAGSILNNPSMSVYTGSLQSPWSNTSWSASVNFAATTPPPSGKSSVQVVASSWGALSLTYNASGTGMLNPAAFDSVEFDVYSNSLNQLAVLLEGTSGGNFKDVYFNVTPKTWTHIEAPIGSLDPSGAAFNRIDLINPSSQVDTFCVGNLQIDSLVAAGSSRGALAGIANGGQNVPAKFALSQNYPNPFNPSTTITFSLPSAENASLKVYNVLGEQVATLTDGYAQEGMHSVVWNPRGIASGIYFYRLVTEKGSITKRMLLLK